MKNTQNSPSHFWSITWHFIMNMVSRVRLLLIVLAYVGFVSLGLPDAVFGVAWPTVRDSMRVSQSAAGMVFFAFGAGYLLTSLFAGRLGQVLRIGWMLAASTAIVAAAMFGFAFSLVWGLFVACAAIHGLGSGAIDAGLNGYAAHSLSARHMNWLHACYCLGAMLGPLLMTAVLADGRPYQLGYEVVGCMMLALSGLFLMTRSQWGTLSTSADSSGDRLGTTQALRFVSVWQHMAVFFLYTGVEMAFSQWTFTVLTELRGVGTRWAGIAVGSYWGSIGLGRVVCGLIAEGVGIDRLLRGGLLAAVVGAGLFAGPFPSQIAFAGLCLIGLGLAPVFPCLMTRTPQRLGNDLSAHAIGFQVAAAMVGAAAIPAALGWVAGQAGLAIVPWGAFSLSVVLWFLHELLIWTFDGKRDRRALEAPGDPVKPPPPV